METCCKLSECSTTEDFNSYTLPRTFDHANRHLILCESHNGIIFGINLNFSQPHKGGGRVQRGQPRDKEGDTECQRGRTRESKEKSGRGD